jgi:peptide deformylase
MDIVHYPHPVLRFKSSEVTRIDEPFRAVVREMFELMYKANGIGLAANQVGLPLRFFVFNAAGERGEQGEELSLINPVIRNRRGGEVGEEGCLSLPGLYGDVRRAEEIVVEAFDLAGQPIRATLTGLPARVVQHEYDHLDGVLFVDRISDEQKVNLTPKLEEFEHDYQSRQKLGEFAADEEIVKQLKRVAASGRLPTL